MGRRFSQYCQPAFRCVAVGSAVPGSKVAPVVAIRRPPLRQCAAIFFHVLRTVYPTPADFDTKVLVCTSMFICLGLCCS